MRNLSYLAELYYSKAASGHEVMLQSVTTGIPKLTPPEKVDVEPENVDFQKESRLHFQVPCWLFRDFLLGWPFLSSEV